MRAPARSRRQGNHRTSSTTRRQKDNADALEKIKASGKIEVHVLTDAEKKAWIAKLMPVHTEMQSRFGKDFIERIYKASGFTPPQS